MIDRQQKKMKHRIIYKPLISLMIAVAASTAAFGITKVSTGSGNFSDGQIWIPAGTPVTGDDVVIDQGHIVVVDMNTGVNEVQVKAGGRLELTAGITLSMSGSLTVSGDMDMKGGNISFLQGSAFNLTDGSTFIWDPGNNTQSGASLFVNGDENFHEGSELIIKKWFSYSGVPLGSLVTGHFGSLTLNSFENGLIYEWNQNNEFETHHIKGKLTIGQAWIVLDKSGSISNTTIGSIELNNVNSFLDIHSGDHPGSFTVQTDSIINIGGTMAGLHNGNGNVNLIVNEDLVNLGYMELIYNSGVPGTGNGNATLQVDGTLEQFDGDFRGIFNLSGSTAGTFQLEAGEVRIHDGIFMGLYACHTSQQGSVFNISGDLILTFNANDSKFRGNGLHSLAGTKSNASFTMQVNGDLIINGPAGAEFTSSGSGGNETISILGAVLQSGAECNFNLGDHNTSITVSGGITMNNGAMYMSRTDGTLALEVDEDVVLSGGHMVLKAASGAGSATFNTELWITGGNLLFHDNMQEPTTEPVFVKVFGDVFHTGGTVSFDNNNSGQPGHVLSLYGKRYITGGNAKITTSLPISTGKAPTLFYDRQGEIEYFENGSSHEIDNVIQVVSPGCSLMIADGNVQCASDATANIPLFIIKENAVVELGGASVYSNGKNDHSLILLNDGATLITSHPNGLMQETAGAAIDVNSGMDMKISPYSVVEYSGGSGQVISGNKTGIPAHDYGILRVNLTTQTSQAVLGASEVKVRKKIELEQGILALGSNLITLETGTPGALSATNGSFHVADLSGHHYGALNWLNMEPGKHVIPFSDHNGVPLQITFEPLNGTGRDIQVTTCATGADNRPLPENTPFGTVRHTRINGNEIAETHMIDRWFLIRTQDIKANVTLQYLPTENSMLPEVSQGIISAMVWTEDDWRQLNGTATATTEQTGSIVIEDNDTWGAICITSAETPGMADLLHFSATLNNDVVDIEWETENGHQVSHYEVLRSADGNKYEPNKTNISAVNSTSLNHYSETDTHPLKGISYYKLKQVNKNGEIKYSQAVRIVNEQMAPQSLSFLHIGPNPFRDQFSTNITVSPGTERVEMKLISMNGQVIFSKRYTVNGDHVKIEFTEGTGLPDGIYLLMATDGIRSIYHKMYKSS